MAVPKNTTLQQDLQHLRICAECLWEAAEKGNSVEARGWGKQLKRDIAATQKKWGRHLQMQKYSQGER